ncbi:MAG: zinc-ribbon and FHA domain-containing protein [Acidimicrobiaceae bacterium]|nr:zinc-ribbon and FHA domain-containing protein [Acidimicrobiaceae bacterium]
MYCNRCGHRNPDGANFCSSCGAPLEKPSDKQPTTVVFGPGDPALDLDDDVTVSLDDVPRGAGVLVVKRGPNAGTRYVLTEGLTSVGRHPDSDLLLDDVTVSRRHVELRRTAGGYTVRDVGSLNGTYVNRERIDSEVQVRHGDELQVGKFRLLFLTESTDR